MLASALRCGSASGAAGRFEASDGDRAGNSSGRDLELLLLFSLLSGAGARSCRDGRIDYLASLKPWRELLPLHFSTWPETPGNTRSDSHAWSAHPAYDLLTLVAGIEPSAPGFASVRVAPHLGDLRRCRRDFRILRG